MINLIVSSIIGLVLGVSSFLALSQYKQIQDVKEDAIIHKEYLIDKCPTGYFPYIFNAGNRYCFQVIAHSNTT